MNRVGTLCLVVVFMVVFAPRSRGVFDVPLPAPKPLGVSSKVAASEEKVIPHANAQTVQLDEVHKGNSKAVILMYHYIRPAPVRQYDPIGYNLSIPPALLEQHLQLYSRLGYKSARLTDMVRDKSDAKSLVLTFDDGYEDFYTTAWPLLKKYNWTATVFIITEKVGQPGYLTWEQIKLLQHRGVEIGAHTLSHADLAMSSQQRQWQEINESKKVLEHKLNIPITTFCYPAGQYATGTFELVRKAGYFAAVTTKPGKLNSSVSPYKLPRYRVEPDTPLLTLEENLRYYSADSVQ
jgi:peptidoglycan/xylan/chitin deacetylase (PgdA/CDA1 family)